MSCNKTCLLGFILVIFTTRVSSQSQANGHFCYNEYGNYSSELDKYSINAALSSLSSNIGDTGFYKASEGGATAAALCRADIQLSECRGCVRIVADDVQRQCPNPLQAIRFTDFCMSWYSNRTVFWTPENFTGYLSYDAFNGTGLGKFDEVRRELMDDLRVEAADGGSLRKAAFGNRSVPDSDQTIFAMVQCTPDLSAENCTSCLTRATSTLIRGGASGASVYTPTCILRFQTQPFYNITRFHELLPTPTGKNNNNTTRTIVIITISVAVVLCVSLALCVLTFLRKRMQHNTKEIHEIGEDNDEISSVESIQYDFGKIRGATDDFSDANKLGRGGFGVVYRGKLQNGREIAVKRLSWGSSQGDFEFKNEVLLMAKLQHRNLVRLLGFSMQGTERLLIYEFVKNGSLDQVLFDPIKSSYLDWETRNKIIGGIAKGLLYLHQDSRLRIIHRDLKASNVLLDEEMNPKISDFGMARLVLPNATQENTSRIVGTYGYMAPEYAIHGHVSFKTDIFTFGVLVLEIVRGQKKKFFETEENSANYLLSYAWRSWREGRSANMIDPVLLSSCVGGEQEMMRYIHIALLCVQQNPDDRPTMAFVVLMLNSSSQSLASPSEPGFYMPSSLSGASLEIPHSSSGNHSEITSLYPR